MQHCHESVCSRDSDNRHVADLADRMTAIPGGVDRAMTAAARLRMYFTVTAIVGGCTAALVMLVRTLLRPGGGGLPSWTPPWATWLLGAKR